MAWIPTESRWFCGNFFAVFLPPLLQGGAEERAIRPARRSFGREHIYYAEEKGNRLPRAERAHHGVSRKQYE